MIRIISKLVIMRPAIFSTIFIISCWHVAAAQTQADTSHLIGYFYGRTPCQELARELNEPTTPECWKIKWRLTLWDNGYQHEKGACSMEGFKFRKENTLRGIWHLLKGTKDDPNAIVYQLDFPGRPSLYLQKADENVLLFLDKEKSIIPGNKNFSYALYRNDE